MGPFEFVLIGSGAFAAIVGLVLAVSRTKSSEGSRQLSIAESIAQLKDGAMIELRGQTLAAGKVRSAHFGTECIAARTQSGASQPQYVTADHFWLFDDTAVVRIDMPSEWDQIAIEQCHTLPLSPADGFETLLYEGEVVAVRGTVHWVNDPTQPLHRRTAGGNYRENRLVLAVIAAEISASGSKLGGMVATRDPRKIPRLQM